MCVPTINACLSWAPAGLLLPVLGLTGVIQSPLSSWKSQTRKEWGKSDPTLEKEPHPPWLRRCVSGQPSFQLAM